MADGNMPNLTFPRLPINSRQTPWDLRLYFYKGSAKLGRRKAAAAIERGELGSALLSRLPVMQKLHEVIAAELERGTSFRTVNSNLKNLVSFIAWVDGQGTELTMDSFRTHFLGWVEHMVHRYRIVKDISHSAAYAYVAGPAKIVGRALAFMNSEPGRSLMKHTRMPAPRRRKRVLGAQAEKRRLTEIFAFGHLMTDLCNELTVEALRGPTPLSISLRDGRKVLVKNGLHRPDIDPLTISDHKKRRAAQKIRAALPADASLLDSRYCLLNLRIEAELLVFIAQTGMNLAQALALRCEQYRWQSDGDELNVFRVYKARRGGEAVFRCYKAYRYHFLRYLDWLDATQLRASDDRLFPFIYKKGGVPAGNSNKGFSATKSVCAKLGVRHVMARELRKTRINWLLRRSRDTNLTAEQSAHTKETLLRIYEEPHFESASVEIVRFHRMTDPTLPTPGPGVCAGAGSGPRALEDAPHDAPQPDCVSPEGCLFCVHHRDVMSADYCWKLASHFRLKNLEATRYRPPKGETQHPAHIVMDRIDAKLHAIASGSEIRALWVREARDYIRAGRYHPLWDGHIQLMETM